jgi:hypothetical protein
MMRLLLRLAFAFEPLAPTAITYYLRRTLNGYKQQGLIGNYKMHTIRLGKFHYRIIVDMEVNRNQAHHFFAHVLPKRSKTLGRWLNV